MFKASLLRALRFYTGSIACGTFIARVTERFLDGPIPCRTSQLRAESKRCEPIASPQRIYCVHIASYNSELQHFYVMLNYPPVTLQRVALRVAVS